MALWEILDFPNQLLDTTYLNFLMNTLLQFLEFMPLVEKLSMCTHDKAPVHFVRKGALKLAV